MTPANETAAGGLNVAIGNRKFNDRHYAENAGHPTDYQMIVDLDDHYA